MKIKKSTTVAEVIEIMFTFGGDDILKAYADSFEAVEIPLLSYGDRVDLSGIKTIEDMLFMPQLILNRRGRDTVLRMSFFEVFNFGKSVLQHLEKLSKRDAETFKYDPSPEEVKAGFMRLSKGIFNTVDAVALRLGITDHNEVFRLPEIRVYTMLKLDFEKAMYDRRLREIAANNYKKK